MFSTKNYLVVETKNLPVKAGRLCQLPDRGASGEKGAFPVLPRPLLRGEVALRSNDGEVLQVT